MKRHLIIISLCLCVLFQYCNVEPKDEREDILNNTNQGKVDSVVRSIINLENFPDSKLQGFISNNDSLQIDEIAPLLKRVYSPSLDVTFEFRQSYNDHLKYEIIVCYNNNNYIGIPFYWDMEENYNKLHMNLFEERLNEAINCFNKDTTNITKGKYQWLFTRTIIDEISLYTIVPLRIHDIQYLIDKTEKLISEGKANFSNIECKEKAIDNLKELNNSNVNVDLFDLPNNYCQMKVEYTSEGIIFEVINNDCFFEIIF